jgi:uncharacterized membrane protein YoaK (UPF0700 family)
VTNALGAANAAHFDEQALRCDAASVRHPLTRALLVLTFSTGIVDAVSYLGLGRVFAANMTGNIVLLGFGIAGSGGLPVLAPIVSLASFVLGAVAGGALVKHLANRHSTLVARTLGIEASLLAVAAIVAAAVAVDPGDPAAYVLIVLMALAMGLRNAVVRRIGVPDLTTTVLTMTLTGLAADATSLGSTGKASIRRLAAVVAMLAGAVAGALALKAALVVPLAIAAVLALATWLGYVPGAARTGR